MKHELHQESVTRETASGERDSGSRLGNVLVEWSSVHVTYTSEVNHIGVMFDCIQQCKLADAMDAKQLASLAWDIEHCASELVVWLMEESLRRKV